MISLNINPEGKPVVCQQMTPPAVYLDVCALMEISANPSLSCLFSELLIKKEGTLMLSGMHLLEFSRMTDQSQTGNVDRLLSKISSRRFGFISVNPREVIEREDEFARTGKIQIAPQVDRRLLKLFSTRKGESLNPLDVRGLFSKLNTPKMGKVDESFVEMMKEISKKVLALREKRNMDTAFRNFVKAAPKPCNLVGLEAATRYINLEIHNYLIRSEINLSDTNHWKDLFHTIVPVAYCSFVVLDRTWADVANKTKARLLQAGHSMEMARVFSMRANSVQDFFVALENYGEQN